MLLTFTGLVRERLEKNGVPSAPQATTIFWPRSRCRQVKGLAAVLRRRLGNENVVGDSDAYNEIPTSVIQLYITETPSSVRRRAAQELEWSVVQAAGDNARANFMAKYVGNSVSRESHAIFARLLEDYSAKYLPKEKCFPAHQ